MALSGASVKLEIDRPSMSFGRSPAPFTSARRARPIHHCALFTE
jgi:hypothetical protein